MGVPEPGEAVRRRSFCSQKSSPPCPLAAQRLADTQRCLLRLLRPLVPLRPHLCISHPLTESNHR
jgi:hypothetical protein